MLGAILGDIVGSVYEFHNTKSYDFEMFTLQSNYTDDSILSLAVADWVMNDAKLSEHKLEAYLVQYAKHYPCPVGGYGGGFRTWVFHPEHLKDYKTGRYATKRCPYNSWGNGSAMRVSAVGGWFPTLEQTEEVAKISAEITHNHPEGIKGAQATATAIYLARTGSSKSEIKEYIEERFGYNLNDTWEHLNRTYSWHSSCQRTVPQAIIAFLESHDFESAIRMAVSMGGDSDTLACITGGIAEAYYGEIPEEMIRKAFVVLPEELRNVLKQFATKCYDLFWCDLIDKF